MFWWASKDFIFIVEMDFERILNTHYFSFKSASSPSVPGLNLKKNCLKPGKGQILVYFKKSILLNIIMLLFIILNRGNLEVAY